MSGGHVVCSLEKYSLNFIRGIGRDGFLGYDRLSSQKSTFYRKWESVGTDTESKRFFAGLFWMHSEHLKIWWAILSSSSCRERQLSNQHGLQGGKRSWHWGGKIGLLISVKTTSSYKLMRVNGLTAQYSLNISKLNSSNWDLYLLEDTRNL